MYITKSGLQPHTMSWQAERRMEDRLLALQLHARAEVEHTKGRMCKMLLLVGALKRAMHRMAQADIMYISGAAVIKVSQPTAAHCAA